ncbi:phage-related minor tail protein [Fontibacillus phaseoli]|uniref:Phage-related minor tail protein n=1 Tax=Fontibacillus phaseoli TaxID=1416533 RepID=A0A369B4J0_9BACL|nr:phage tail tape measure protein [Fontibacillus phaseoli]RCX16462.1 phage-related minor tail protein [Fontibacillus phaseoli]
MSTSSSLSELEKLSNRIKKAKADLSKLTKGTVQTIGIELAFKFTSKKSIKKYFNNQAAEIQKESQKAARLAAEQAKAAEEAAEKATIAYLTQNKGKKAKQSLRKMLAAKEAREKAAEAARAAKVAAIQAEEARKKAAGPKSIRRRISEKFDEPKSKIAAYYKRLRYPLGNFGNNPLQSWWLKPNLPAKAGSAKEKAAGAASAAASPRDKIASAFSTAGNWLSSVKDQSLEAAKVFDAAYVVLRSTSGASQKEMESLLQSFRVVGGQVPQSLSEVGKAMGILQRDTTLTGTDLEDLSKLLLTASRLTGSDSAVAAESAARAMSVWGRAAKDAGPMLEQFFAASRAGKVNMGDLMKRMAQFGVPMQQMGLSFEQSMVLLAKWQKEGINPIEDALKKKMPAGGFADLADGIKKAATSADAAKLVLDNLGPLVGGDLVTALKGGQVEFNGMLGAMNQSKDGIMGHAEALQSFGDRFDTLKNRITIALAPLGEALLPFGEGMVAALEFVMEYADIMGAALLGMSAVLITAFAPALWASVTALWASAMGAWALVIPFLPLIAIVALVGAAFGLLAYLVKYHMDDIQSIIDTITGAIAGAFKWVSDGIKGALLSAWEFVKEKFNEMRSWLGLGVSTQASVQLNTNGTSPVASAGGPPTSKYHGMDYVPYDGMMARLHKGERIMTASENREFSQGGTGGAISITGNTFNVRQESDIDAIARALAREIKTAGGLMA